MKKHYLKVVLLLLILAIVLNTYLALNPLFKKEIIIGVMNPTSGPLAAVSAPVTYSIQLAAEEINRQGGIGGKKIKLIIENPGSDYHVLAQLTEKLMLKDHANILIGCWASACRKAMKPVVEQYHGLLLYPTHYEGLEQSNNIIYLGATPNQQVVPAINWMMKNYGKKVYLVGSDAIYSRVINFIARTLIVAQGGEIMGEQYLPLDSMKVAPIVEAVKKVPSDFILCSIHGVANLQFFDQLYAQAPAYPGYSISVSIPTVQVRKIKPQAYPKLFVAWNYSTTLTNPQNKHYLTAYRQQFGTLNYVNDPAATAYAGLYLLKQAIEQIGNDNPELVRTTLLRSSVPGPMGVLYIDGFTGHAWRQAIIMKFNAQGHEEIVWQTNTPIEPMIFPKFESQKSWFDFEQSLYNQWHQSWENTSP